MEEASVNSCSSWAHYKREKILHCQNESDYSHCILENKRLLTAFWTRLLRFSWYDWNSNEGSDAKNPLDCLFLLKSCNRNKARLGGLFCRRLSQWPALGPEIHRKWMPAEIVFVHCKSLKLSLYWFCLSFAISVRDIKKKEECGGGRFCVKNSFSFSWIKLSSSSHESLSSSSSWTCKTDSNLLKYILF